MPPSKNSLDISRYRSGLLFLAGWTLFFYLFWFNTFSYTPLGDLQVSHVNLWGDWAVHFTIGSSFAYNRILPGASPLIIGYPLSYPFVNDWISGMLIRLGMPFISSFIIPSFILSILGVLALVLFYRSWFNNRQIALLATTIFLLNGGVGFIYYLQDVAKSPNPLTTVLVPPRTYTNYRQKRLEWINVIDSMFTPQRSFVLGLPLSLLALGLIYTALKQTKSQAESKWRHRAVKTIAAGIIIGLLPIIHSHSFLAIFVILAAWSLASLLITTRQKRPAELRWWLLLVAVVSLIAVPLIKQFMLTNIANKQFWQWFPGWYAAVYHLNWLLFWFLNWGGVPFMAVAGLAIYVKRLKTTRARLHGLLIFAPFFIIFAAANLFLFQPYIWDNTKLIVWSSIGFSGLTAYFLYSLWNLSLPLWLIKVALRSGIALVFFLTVFSGLIDTVHLIPFKAQSYVMYSREELQLANWVKDNTPTNSIWLTSDNHNHWLFNLTGRQTLAAYPGWLWTHGYNFYPIKNDVKQMYTQPLQSQNLFDKYQVDYIVIDPLAVKETHANVSQLTEMFEVIKETEHYLILKN